MLSVSAATDMDLKEKNIRFIRLPGEYDNLSNAKILPLNIIGTKTRMYNTLSVPITTTFFRGRIPVKKDQFMVYRLYSRNIFDINDFWSDNDIELYYSTKHFEGGFGSSGSFLGKNLYVRNSFYGDLEQRLGDYNNIYLFANKSLLEKSYSVAAGHELTTQVFSMMNSGAYSDNSLVDARTRSLRNVSSLTFAPRNTVSYQGLYYETMANSENSIDAINYEHKVNYRGRISDVVTLNAYNEYRLLDTEIREQYSNTARGSAGVRLGKKGFMVSGIYANSKKEQLQKSDGSSDYEIVSEQATAQLSLPSIRKTRIITGVTYKNLTQDASGNNVWQSDEYNYFLKANSYGTRMQYRAEVTIGIRDALHSGYVLDRAFHKSATATLKRKLGLSGEYSLNLNYSDGVITGTNWGQSLEEKFSASAAYKQYLYKKMLALNVTGAYDHSTLRSDAMVLNTALEGTLKNNLELILKSSFRSNTDAILSFTSIEATISKGFDINRKKANYYDFVVVCFKDLNGNGKYDSREPGIENIQVSLQLLQEDESFTKAGQAVKFKNAALLSGKSGTVTCTYMPAGEYELQLLPLSDLKGFFNFSGSAQQINLNKNTKHYVPYIQAARIYGMIDIQKSNFSQTDKMGYYTLYVPKNRNYKVSINNIMGSKFQLEQNNIPVSMKDKAKESVNFIFKEKKRKINFSRG